MSRKRSVLRQLVDWRAAAWSGLVAGTVFLAINWIAIPRMLGMDGGVMVRYFASTVLGAEVLDPQRDLSTAAVGAALGSHFVLSFAAAALLAIIIHRYGLVVGILGGALFGLALYVINIYTLTYFLPWFFALEGKPFMLAHVVFGAFAGGAYEALEVERFVDEEGREVTS